jgi:YD repeat-containing protein
MALGHATSYTYDSNGNRLTETNSLGTTTFWAPYDLYYDPSVLECEVLDSVSSQSLRSIVDKERWVLIE